MAIWLVRAGSAGEFEDKFIGERRVYVTWEGLDVNLTTLTQREQLHSALAERFPDAKPKKLQNWTSQVWPFSQRMQVGDWVVVPLKTQPVIYIGEIVGDYQFAGEGPDPFFHWRSVKWIGEAIPRSHFSQDLLYSFGAFMTICRIQRNNAEGRLKAMAANGWQPESLQQLVKDEATASDEVAVEQAETDLERLGAMSKFNASQGLFVAWGGYRSNVQKELASSFFRLRLWNQDDLLEQLFLHYDHLDESIKSELPLKRIWTAVLTDDV
ncbi:restriction endonuclease [Pseudomonas aeruginosa]|nr:restriction endonuclease [Pseudomonas aeruginosa]